MTDSVPGNGARRTLRRAGVAALALAFTAGALAASPALAEPRYEHGYYDRYHHWHPRPLPPPIYGYGYVAAPPPIVYAPPPPAVPGITLIIPLHIR
jgi:hypothetical protein